MSGLSLTATPDSSATARTDDGFHREARSRLASASATKRWRGVARVRALSGLIERQQLGRPIFGLPADLKARRWISADGGPGDVRLAHGEPRPHPEQLVTVGVLSTRVRGGFIDPYDTFGAWLLIAESSRNDSAFQAETVDPSAIAAAVESVPGPEAWTQVSLEVDRSPSQFQRQERGGDWIAFSDIGDGECLWVLVEQPDGAPISIARVSEISPYLEDPASARLGSGA